MGLICGARFLIGGVEGICQRSPHERGRHSLTQSRYERAVAHHALTIEDRGVVHRHRWVGSCTCGWRTTPIRSKRTVKSQYRAHVNKQAAMHVGRLRENYGPRPVTPVEDLPEGLR